MSDDFVDLARTIKENEGKTYQGRPFYAPPDESEPIAPPKEEGVRLVQDDYLGTLAEGQSRLAQAMQRASTDAKKKASARRTRKQAWQPKRGVFASPPMADDESEVLFAPEPAAVLRFVRRRRHVFALRQSEPVGSPQGLLVYPTEFTSIALRNAAMGPLGLLNFARRKARVEAERVAGQPVRFLGAVAVRTLPFESGTIPDGRGWRERVQEGGENLRVEFFFEAITRREAVEAPMSPAERLARLNGTGMGLSTQEASQRISAMMRIFAGLSLFGGALVLMTLDALHVTSFGVAVPAALLGWLGALTGLAAIR